MKVKIFTNKCRSELESDINKFIEHNHITPVFIKQSEFMVRTDTTSCVTISIFYTQPGEV